MPQGHKKPFSGKAKKQQMKEKKQRQNRTLLLGRHSKGEGDRNSEDDEKRDIQKIGIQPSSSGSGRYVLQFFQDTREELKKRREDAFRSIEPIAMENQEIADDYFPAEVDMPKRPPWNFNMKKEQLEYQEQKYFAEYLKCMENVKNISYFELNLETWRQLWRVLEMSDVLLIIIDIRYPTMMFPPYLYNYVTKILQKDMILIMNKIDLAPPSLVIAWKEYFIEHYPELRVLTFTSFPTYNIRGNIEKEKGLVVRCKKGKMKMAAEGAQKLLETCREIVGSQVDLSSWMAKIQEEMDSEYDLDDLKRNEDVEVVGEDASYFHFEKYKNGVLTIGCIGNPNVGKSSLMNALMGKKVVSVSRTPGHTKHFQTIYLTQTVCLCDCPGLVFPSTVPKPIQILMGSFPIAQVREPYSSIRYLAERIDLVKLLKLRHQDNDDTWSPMDICDSWAAQRRFFTAKAGRLDSYRAANSLLRMALEGKICVFAYPPMWTKKKEYWLNHPEIGTITWIQARNQDFQKDGDFRTQVYSSSSEEEVEEKKDSDSNSGSSNQGSENEDEAQESDGDKQNLVANKFEILSTDA